MSLTLSQSPSCGSVRGRARRLLGRVVALSLVLALVSCGADSPESHLEQGKAALTAGNYDAALASFEKAEELLRGSEPTDPVKKLRYRARLGIVEAKTKLKDGQGAHEEFAMLAADHAPQMDWKVYRKVADDMQSSGCVAEAVKVLDQGKNEFPEKEEEFTKVIESIKAVAAEGSDVHEALKSLGYVK